MKGILLVTKFYSFHLQCSPLSGFGFQRGGYACSCKAGHVLPPGQHGPFQGVDIEAATQEEYEEGFHCIPEGMTV